jgi:magnesium transporter
MEGAPQFDQSVLTLARQDYVTLRQDLTVEQALQQVRERGAGERIIYFYVVDEHDRLCGVLPTRRLLVAQPEQRLSEIMVSRLVTIPHTATVLEACEAFTLYKFLAFPVVDERRRIVGVVDVGSFTEEVLDYAEREQTDAAFEAIGLHVEQLRQASPLRAFRFRLPWLLATITSGMICAVLTGAFEATLAESLVLAFFLTLVLGLGESVATQSLTVTVQTLRHTKPTLRWFTRALAR